MQDQALSTGAGRNEGENPMAPKDENSESSFNRKDVYTRVRDKFREILIENRDCSLGPYSVGPQ